jgi:phosphocarrier protein
MTDATAGSDEVPPRAHAAALLRHPNGLHARPAIRLTKLAKRFDSRVGVGLSAGGPFADAKSVAKVMALKIPSGVTLFFDAAGRDAAAAVAALAALVEGDFADGEPG